MTHRYLFRILMVFILLLMTVSTAYASSKFFTTKPAKRNVLFTGFTRPRVLMTLVSEESARCDKVYADVGDYLDKSGKFAELDPTFVKLELNQISAEIEQDKADVAFYSKEANRYKRLVNKNTAAQSDLDMHVKNLKRAQAHLKSLRVRYATTREHLNRYTIRGVKGWRVIERYIEPGEWVTKGEKVAELGNFNTLFVPFTLSVAELETIQKNNGKVDLYIPDLKIKVKAKLQRISPDFDVKSRKIKVDFEITDGAFEFRGGLRSELTISMIDSRGSVLVPKSAILKAYEENFLVRPDGVRVKVLKLDSPSKSMVRVASPAVKAGEKFLLKP